jgi:hypothetical protein
LLKKNCEIRYEQRERKKKEKHTRQKKKLGRQEIHACEKYVKKNQMCIKEKGEKGILKSLKPLVRAAATRPC